MKKIALILTMLVVMVMSGTAAFAGSVTVLYGDEEVYVRYHDDNGDAYNMGVIIREVMDEDTVIVDVLVQKGWKFSWLDDYDFEIGDKNVFWDILKKSGLAD